MASNSREQLTARQQQVLSFIQERIESVGYPPTIREIGAHLGIRSTNGVNDHLKALERKGYLQRTEAKSRACVPIDLDVDVDEDMVEVPVLGRIAAGAPILATEHVEDTVKIDRFFLGRSREVFALRVVGESMINDGIHDGDFIFVRKQQIAPRGSIVCAMIDGEATVKRYFNEGDRIRFQPANDAMEPIFVAATDFKQTQIVGVVVGVYRRMDHAG